MPPLPLCAAMADYRVKFTFTFTVRLLAYIFLFQLRSSVILSTAKGM
jgi:hypothetical protein